MLGYCARSRARRASFRSLFADSASLSGGTVRRASAIFYDPMCCTSAVCVAIGEHLCYCVVHATLRAVRPLARSSSSLARATVWPGVVDLSRFQHCSVETQIFASCLGVLLHPGHCGHVWARDVSCACVRRTMRDNSFDVAHRTNMVDVSSLTGNSFMAIASPGVSARIR